MSYIKIIPPSEASGLLKEVYQRITEEFGLVHNRWKVDSLFPEVVAFRRSFDRLLMTGSSTLSRIRRIMIALVVSNTNQCTYEILYHQNDLIQLVRDEEWVKQLIADPEKTSLESSDREMLKYAIKLTRQPSQANGEDIEKLRSVGFSDREIVEIVTLTGYTNFSNRILNGFGVDPE